MIFLKRDVLMLIIIVCPIWKSQQMSGWDMKYYL